MRQPASTRGKSLFKEKHNAGLPPHHARGSQGNSERGASAVEYGLLIAGIAALIVVVVFAFGDNLTDIFNDTCDAVTASAGCATRLIVLIEEISTA